MVTTIAGSRSEVIRSPCSRPKPTVNRTIRIRPAASGPVATPSGTRNEAKHDAKTGQRTDRQIDGADQHRGQLRTG